MMIMQVDGCRLHFLVLEMLDQLPLTLIMVFIY